MANLYRTLNTKSRTASTPKHETHSSDSRVSERVETVLI